MTSAVSLRSGAFGNGPLALSGMAAPHPDQGRGRLLVGRACIHHLMSKLLRSGEGALFKTKKVAVLVVEDVPQARATAVSIMEDLGCAVFDAYNGPQALKLLQAHPDIQVLFADVRMPGMSGTELAEAAQRLRPDLKIVLTSGYVGPQDVPAHIPFVPKPWRAEPIADVVTKVH